MLGISPGRYSGRGIDREDLVQVANYALVKAIRGFHHDRGEFVPFATVTILGEIKKYFRDHGWGVRPPRRIQQAPGRHHQAGRAPSSDAGLGTPADRHRRRARRRRHRCQRGHGGAGLLLAVLARPACGRVEAAARRDHPVGRAGLFVHRRLGDRGSAVPPAQRRRPRAAATAIRRGQDAAGDR
ncbi:sigma factor [Aeromicrobium sp. UC242_57]|uniref:sigma factor n=1 Tax=Aeromicrobium sp. UC242_57 TaxID=3374624 RepID=UPI0037C0B516